MGIKQYKTDNFKKAFGEIPSSYTQLTLTRRHSHIRIFNGLDQDIVIAFDANQNHQEIVPAETTTTQMIKKFDTLYYKYYDSAPTFGNLVINCEYRDDKR